MNKTHTHIYVYINDIIVDCVWSDWVEGDCSTTCGAGQQNYTRTKLIEETNGGNCTGESTENLSCLVLQCPGKYPNFNIKKELGRNCSIMYVY